MSCAAAGSHQCCSVSCPPSPSLPPHPPQPLVVKYHVHMPSVSEVSPTPPLQCQLSHSRLVKWHIPHTPCLVECRVYPPVSVVPLPLFVKSTLRASLSGTFLQTLPDLVTLLKGHSLSPRSCPPTQSAPSERFGS